MILGVGWLLLRTGRGALPVITILCTVRWPSPSWWRLNPLVYIIGTGITYPATGLLLVIVGVGGLLTNRVWATAVIITVNVAWVFCAVVYGLPVPPAVFAAQLAKANALAIVLAVARIRTVRRMEQARRQIHQMAVTDELTGLANHRGLLESAPTLRSFDREPSTRAGRGVSRCRRARSREQTGPVTWPVISCSGRSPMCSAESVRSSDILARVGGDEFAVLLVGADPRVTRADSLTASHRQLTRAGISASIGTFIAHSTTGSLDTEIADLLDEADHAMYATKAGREEHHQMKPAAGPPVHRIPRPPRRSRMPK